MRMPVAMPPCMMSSNAVVQKLDVTTLQITHTYWVDPGEGQKLLRGITSDRGMGGQFPLEGCLQIMTRVYTWKISGSLPTLVRAALSPMSFFMAS